ncbi:MAG: hypothetical protein MMC33_008057, partial [Icmadophila ericetorum]|nr:hypothetical protein [Icmadophila ericetorum]
MSLPSALEKLNTEKYTLQDAMLMRNPQAYIQRIAKYCTNAGLVDEYVQSTYAYNQLDPELQLLIKVPKEGSTALDFLRKMETEKK